jgi:Family of unknown function (DUF5681)/Transposase domain (DUF772)
VKLLNLIGDTMSDEMPADKPDPARDRKGRFGKGQSGNPRGRPPNSCSLKKDFNKLMNKPISVRENGKTKRIRSQMAFLTRLLEKALLGDMRASSKLLDTIIKLNPPTISDNETGKLLSATDKEILATYLSDAMPTQVVEQGLGTRHSDGGSSAAGDRAIATTGADGLHNALDARISTEHPLRQLRQLANDATAALSTDFTAYATKVRPVISPDKLVRAWLLRFFCTIPTDGLLVEELGYNPVYRWFVGVSIDEPEWTLAEFTTSFDSLRSAGVFSRFERTFLTNSNVQQYLLSDEASFSMLTEFAHWCGYLPRRGPALGEANDENRKEE